MRVYYSYYNTSLLVLDEYNLIQKSLYELYTLRKKIKDNKNYIVEKVNAKIIDIIEKVINSKSNGEILMTLIRDNSRLAQDILNDETIKIKNNFKLLKFYKNINKIEKIFNFEKNSLLTDYQIKQRFILRLKYYFTKIKEKLLLCKI
jgi:phosphoglycerate-specific signal transduction histidine kinase